MKINMKIVAFLQNMWVLPRSVPVVTKHGPISDARERMIEYALFAGCLTGRRLKKAFGEELCEQIIWQEASPVIADNPKDYHAPDPEHIAAVLQKHNPDVVLCFTKAGESVIKSVCGDSIRFVPVVHPACRHESTMEKLMQAANLIRQ